MTELRIVVVIVLNLVVFSASCQLNGTANENTLNYLKKFRTDFSASMLSENPETIRTYLADDIRLMPEFQKTILNKVNVLSYWKSFAERFDTQEFSRTEVEVLDIGSRIIEIGTFSTKLKSRGNERIVEMKGKYFDLWERKDGSIWLLTQAWNYNHAINFADQLKFSEIPSINVAYEAHVPVNSPVRFELAALNQLMETVVSQGDAKMWSQFYADDASWLYTASPGVRGRKSLDEFFDRHVKDLPVFEKLNIRNDRVDDLVNYVVEYASHIAVIRNGDFSGVFTGKDLVLWRREPNGSLKIFKHIAMYD